MLTSRRKQTILDVLKRERQVIAKSLSESLGVSEDTIRRDLRELAAEGLLQRVHGGALPMSPAAANFQSRQSLGVAGKAAIGKFAASMLQPKQVVILDGGTTAVQVARNIPIDLEITIVTHSPSIAVELCGHNKVEVILIGGRLFKHSIVAVGSAAEEAIRRIRADLYFMGVTGVHPEVGLTTGDFEEASIKHSLSRSAAETFILASAEKIGTASSYLVMPLSEASGIITEEAVSEEDLAPYLRMGLNVTRAK